MLQIRSKLQKYGPARGYRLEVLRLVTGTGSKHRLITQLLTQTEVAWLVTLAQSSNT